VGIISISQLQLDSKRLLDRVETRGEPLLITRYGQPIAALVPTAAEGQPRTDRPPDSVMVRELQRETKSLLKRVASEGRPLVVTRRGMRIAVLVPISPTDTERYIIAASSSFLAARARAEAAGTTIARHSLERVAQELGVRAPAPHRTPGPRALVFEHIQSHLAKILECDAERIDYDSAFVADLDAASLDLHELVDDLEGAYGVRMSDEEAETIGTVGEAVDFVMAYGAAPILEAEATRIVNAFGESKRSAKNAVRDAYARLPAQVAALTDAGGEDQMTLEQFATGRASGPDQTHSRAKIIEPAIVAIADLVANSDNGRITRDRFARWMREVGVVEEADAYSAFHAIDSRGDGVSPDEFLRAVRDTELGVLDVNLLGRSVLAMA
jgi:acyl carrier protein